MVAPLLLAGLAELRGWSLLRWRRLVELTALAGFLVMILARAGLLPTVVSTLFLLCGARLCLPRELPERRQILLMGFLLFLTTAITTSELGFFLWAVLWAAGASAVLLEQNWGKSALLRQGLLQAPPFRRVVPWTGVALILASGFFVVLPRLRLGFRGLPGQAQGLNGFQAGLSDVLDLDGKGPVQSSREVALRVLPRPGQGPEARQALAAAGALLRCFVLEGLEGQRWEISPFTPVRGDVHWTGALTGNRSVTADFFVGSSLLGIIPLPYGRQDLEPSGEGSLHHGRGASVRFGMEDRRATQLQVALAPSFLDREPAPSGHRRAFLLAPGRNTNSALLWSLRVAPGDLPPQELAQRLTEALRQFRYTLDNPSGNAPNPLSDFLERSQAGHCEYFASALAIMLRLRGVPSRVANGFRLGPWLEEGGYFLVTQGEAHSWVEYYDGGAGGWRVADPTPAAPPSGLGLGPLVATLERWTDALRFQWDLHVVRFSDQDQIAGLDWLQARTRAVAAWRPRLSRPRFLAWAGAAAVLAWAVVAVLRRPGGLRLPGRGEGSIRELAPLVRRTRTTLPPLAGETARAWLARLAQACPERAEALEALAREAEAVAYGETPRGKLKLLAKAEARAFKA
jgi:hypothetical protein